MTSVQPFHTLIRWPAGKIKHFLWFPKPRFGRFSSVKVGADFSRQKSPLVYGLLELERIDDQGGNWKLVGLERKLTWLLLYEWEWFEFFPVGRGIWFEPRAPLSVGDQASAVVSFGKKAETKRATSPGSGQMSNNARRKSNPSSIDRESHARHASKIVPQTLTVIIPTAIHKRTHPLLNLALTEISSFLCLKMIAFLLSFYL